MREVGRWRKALVGDLSALKAAYGPLPMSVGELFDIELVLTIMKQIFPGQNPKLAWAVLNGHPLPALKSLSEQQKRAMTLTRLHLPSLIARRSWEDSVALYKVVPSPYPLYRVEKNNIFDQPNAILLQERSDCIQQALSQPPEWKTRQIRYATTGRYRFSVQREWYEVELPSRVEAFTTRSIPRLPSNGGQQRQPIVISLLDLAQEADWMDRHAPSGSAAAQQRWGQRIRDIQLQLIHQTGLQASTQLMLSGLLHMIGMVGSGKSTMLTVLAVFLARRGFRVALVLSDVAAIFRELAVFHALCTIDPAIQAMPLLGRSTRVEHLNRLYQTEIAQGDFLRREHAAYPFLSTICPLDGLRQDVEAIPPGEEPCTRLYLVGSNGESERHDCPLLPVCPVHHMTRSFPTAQIWLATPASLLTSGPQGPLIPETMRYIDLVMRYAHVLLVDEADLVQVQFDDRFAPMEVLVRERGESWLDRIATQVSRQMYRSGRPLVGKIPGLDRWLIAHDNTQRAVNRLYIHLRDSDSTIRRWLGNTYFSHDILISRLVDDLNGLIPLTEQFARQASKFKYSPLVIPLENRQSSPGGTPSVERKDDGKPPLAWYRAMQLELLESDTPLALKELKEWFHVFCVSHPINEQIIEKLALRLLITLLVIILDHALQAMIWLWPATEALDLDRGSGGLFYDPSEDQLRMVPEAPMGAVLGFQYYDSHGDGNGELRFFHVRGMGRSLLYHLHENLQISDNLPGPHVLLTSGTSWAPTSWRYHVDIPPGVVLLPQNNQQLQQLPQQQGRIECVYDPLLDPGAPGKYLHVSGLEEPEQRIRSLRAMIDMLTRAQAFRSGMLDAELAMLDPHRQRILLVVGSYYEAVAIGDFLATILAEQHPQFVGDEVVTLVPDREGEGNNTWQSFSGKLRRSLLNQLAQSTARFLVAPLQSIERGHNILIGQEAAIGSVYFLVRPYPVPGDIHTAIHKLNSWARSYVPTLIHPQATQAGLHLRRAASQQWEQALGKGKTYKELNDNERTALLWTQFVLVWQCIGRLLRGGASARVHFVDARWAENSPFGKADTEKTSMLLGFRRILQEAIMNPDPVHRAIATTLYEEAFHAFSNIQGVYDV